MLVALDALWEYQTTANTVPPDPSAVTVPAAGWSGPSQAPFGTFGAGFVTNLTAETAWATGTGLWLRRSLNLDGQGAVLLRGKIDNACFVYIDGEFVGAANSSNGARSPGADFEIVIPQALASDGAHILAVLCLDEAGGADASTLFYLTADYLPAMLPLWPGVPVAETITWMNDVTIYENGGEDREQLRAHPRHQYRMSYFVPREEQPRVVNMLWGARASQWLVPVWSQALQLGAVAAGASTLETVTSYSEYRAGSLLLLWDNPRRWQVLGVDSVVDADTLALATLTEEFTNAVVMPVRRGFLDGDPTRTYNGRTSKLEAVFNIEDNAALTVAAPEQYLGDDIYFDPGMLDGKTENESVTTRLDLVDEDLGLVTYWTPWTNNRVARVHRMVGEDPAEAWTIREFLHRRAGRLRPFWHPSFEADLRVVSSGALTTTMTVALDDYLRFASARDHIAVETNTGWLARQITGTLQTGDNSLQLTLSSSIAVDASQIQRVSFLGLRRLAADRAEINFIGGTACSCAVPVLDIAP